jgi:phospholipase/carboxylesterase
MSYAIGLGAGRPAPAGILANSGFIPEVDGWSADLDGRRDLPVLIHHGAADPVIAIEFGRAARDRLEAAGMTPAYRETSAGHWLPPEIVPELREFAAAAVASRPAV